LGWLTLLELGVEVIGMAKSLAFWVGLTHGFLDETLFQQKKAWTDLGQIILNFFGKPGFTQIF